MMRSLFSGVAGLRNHQTKMDVIGDNISNVNTVGFKKSTVTFQDLLVQTLRGASAPQGGRGGTNAMQVGLGMGLGSINAVNTQGNLQNTGKTTDLAIDGDGFFVVSDGANRFYTRTGTLDVDKDGDLIMSSNGLKVVGWKANTAGVIDTNQAVGNINVPVGTSIAAKQSSGITFTKNLNSVDDTVNNPNKRVTTSTTVYDSLGGAHSVNITFAKPVRTQSVKVNNAILDLTNPSTHDQQIQIGDDNGVLRNVILRISKATNATAAGGWNVSIVDLDGTTTLRSTAAPVDLTSGTATLAAGGAPWTQPFTVAFPSSTTGTYKGGNVEYVADPVTPASATANTWYWTATNSDPNVSSITLPAPPANKIEFNDDGSFKTGGGIPITLNYNAAYGAANTSVNVSLSGLTQYASETTITGTGDGYTSGSLQSIALDSNGVITGSFTNGITQSIGQVALAAFSNPGGLTRVGGSLYKESNNSGTAQVGTSNNGGRGKITPGALEMSNVDMAQEFTDMIVTQRGFQANSKIITTTDEMLEQLANLKR